MGDTASTLMVPWQQMLCLCGTSGHTWPCFLHRFQTHGSGLQGRKQDARMLTFLESAWRSGFPEPRQRDNPPAHRDTGPREQGLRSHHRSEDTSTPDHPLPDTPSTHSNRVSALFKCEEQGPEDSLYHSRSMWVCMSPHLCENFRIWVETKMCSRNLQNGK